MHSMRVLLDLLPELLVEFGSLSGSGGAAAGQSLGAGQPRRGDRRTARQSRGPVPALSLPHHHELLEGMPEGPQPGEGDRRVEEGYGRPPGVRLRVPDAARRHEMTRCRPGTVTNSEFGKVPDRPRTT